MATASNSYDVVILGSGIAGLAGALAAHELGLGPVVLEKAAALGGGTVHSYGLIWVARTIWRAMRKSSTAVTRYSPIWDFWEAALSTRLDRPHLSPTRRRSLSFSRLAGSGSGYLAAKHVLQTLTVCCSPPGSTPSITASSESVFSPGARTEPRHSPWSGCERSAV
jgi:glycine/D-amino acid oxidase-like deaminating enzyme